MSTAVIKVSKTDLPCLFCLIYLPALSSIVKTEELGMMERQLRETTLGLSFI